MATIKDVAKRANVSISTVSHVINHTKYVSDDTASKVEQAIKELNYKTNMFAKNLKSQSTRQIGVVVLDICGLFFPYVIKSICAIANKNNYTVTLYDSHGDLELEKKALSTLVDNCVDGIILSSSIPAREKETYAQELHELLASGPKEIPLVMLERDFTLYGFDSICTDTYEGGMLAMNHLLNLGCKHIAHISVPIKLEGRYLAYRTALEEHKIAFHNSYLECGNYTHESGYECMKAILERELPLDGVFVANDQMAIGAIRAIREARFSIPYDVKIIGFDNVFICDSLNPPLSSVHVEKDRLGGASISLLLERINHGLSRIPYKEILEHSLIVRNSTVKNAPASVRTQLPGDDDFDGFF